MCGVYRGKAAAALAVAFESVSVVDVASCCLRSLSPPGSILSVWLEEVPVSTSGHAALHAGQCGQCLVVTPLGCVFGMAC